MSVITTMTSLFPCDNARKNISPLFENNKIKSINSMTKQNKAKEKSESGFLFFCHRFM